MLRSIENSWHLGISEEVFVIIFHLTFLIVGFCSHYQLFLTVQCIATRKKKEHVIRKSSVKEELGVKSAYSKGKFS